MLTKEQIKSLGWNTVNDIPAYGPEGMELDDMELYYHQDFLDKKPCKYSFKLSFSEQYQWLVIQPYGFVGGCTPYYHGFCKDVATLITLINICTVGVV